MAPSKPNHASVLFARDNLAFEDTLSSTDVQGPVCVVNGDLVTAADNAAFVNTDTGPAEFHHGCPDGEEFYQQKLAKTIGFDEQGSSPSTKRRWVVTLCILLTEMFERLAFYSVSANMVLYCTSELGMSSVDGTTVGLVFNALSNLFPVLGGYISDSWLGRYRTIIISGMVNLAGLVLVQVSAIRFENWTDGQIDQPGRFSIYMVGLVLLTIGTGGIKANISPFGAEQLQGLGPEALQSFFNWFYWSINLGALVAYVGVAYLQQNISFTWGLAVPLVVTVLEIAIFAAPSALYITSPPQGSVISTTADIIKQGCCTSRKSSTPNSSIEEVEHKPSLARARQTYGGDHDDVTVDGVVGVLSVLPFCGLVIMFYALYSQTTSSFFVQSLRMDVRVAGLKVPAAMLNSIGNVSILLLIPVIDRLFYPCMRKLGLPLNHMKRIGIGMILSMIAIVVAGGIEIYRKDVMESPGGSHVQVLADKNFTASSLTVFAQVPQFALVGASEIFTSVTCLEFAYTQAPVSLQGLLTGLFLAAWGLGNLLSMAILLVVKQATKGDPWYGDEINTIHMERLMFLLAAMMLANFLVFCAVAYRFKYRTVQSAQEDVSPDLLPDNKKSSPNDRSVSTDKTDINGFCCHDKYGSVIIPEIIMDTVLKDKEDPYNSEIFTIKRFQRNKDCAVNSDRSTEVDEIQTSRESSTCPTNENRNQCMSSDMVENAISTSDPHAFVTAL